MEKTFHTLAVWCSLYDSWGSLITSERDDVINGLAERMAALLPIPVRVITTKTGEDDEIVPVLLKLRRPRKRDVEQPASENFAGLSAFDDME